MKKEFRLEKILDFRNRKLDFEKAKMRDLQNKERSILEQMNELALLINEKENEMDADCKNGIFDFVIHYVKFIGLKKNELTFLDKAHKEILNQIEGQKVVLSQRLREVKIIEKLKEKHMISYLAFLKKQEEAGADEFNITRRKNEEI